MFYWKVNPASVLSLMQSKAHFFYLVFWSTFHHIPLYVNLVFCMFFCFIVKNLKKGIITHIPYSVVKIYRKTICSCYVFVQVRCSSTVQGESAAQQPLFWLSSWSKRVLPWWKLWKLSPGAGTSSQISDFWTSSVSWTQLWLWKEKKT